LSPVLELVDLVFGLILQHENFYIVSSKEIDAKTL